MPPRVILIFSFVVVRLRNRLNAAEISSKIYNAFPHVMEKTYYYLPKQVKLLTPLFNPVEDPARTDFLRRGTHCKMNHLPLLDRQEVGRSRSRRFYLINYVDLPSLNKLAWLVVHSYVVCGIENHFFIPG